MTQYQVASGAAVYAEGSWAMAPGFGFSMSYTVNFENATADYDLARGPEALRLAQAGQPVNVIGCSGPDGYIGELTHILDSIRTGNSPIVVTIRDALSAVEICEAEEKSVLTASLVRL